MIEYVEREAVLDLQHRLYHSPLSNVIELSPTYIISPDAVQRLPAADVAPVRHGQWIENRWSTEDDWGVINWHSLTCSVCKHEERTNGLSSNSIYKYDYCPHCGAKMDNVNK